LRRLKSKIVGFVLVLCVLVSVYTLVVQAVQQFGDVSLIRQLSLFGSNCTDGNRTQFYAGETLSIRADVSAGDVYSVTIYGKNGSVYSQNGRIHCSLTVVYVPLNPPSFRANESYVVAFSASISVYPIPGASATDTRIAVFRVLASGTKLGLSCDYDSTLHELSLSATLVTGQGVPVANKTIKFDLQLNTSSYIQDRGWLTLSSAKTSADGLAKYVMGCNLFSGVHYVRAWFEGDSDFGGSTNTTRFAVMPSEAVIQSVSVATLTGGTEYAIKVTDQSGYPLPGKTIQTQDPQSSRTLYAVTNKDGRASLMLNDTDSSSSGKMKFTVLGDLFTSQSTFTLGSAGYSTSPTPEPVPQAAPKPTASQNISGLRVSISPARPYAILPAQVNATYNGWIQPGSLAYFSFLLDGVRELSRVPVIGQGNATYSVPLQWCPDVVGQHNITVEIYGSYGARSYGAVSYGATSAGKSVAFSVDPSPDNLQLYTPQVVYGSTALFSLVFTRARQYNQTGSTLFSSFNTAPSVTISGQVYKIDWGVNSTSVSLSVNRQPVAAKPLVTDENGVACINFTVNLTANPETLNFYANKTDNTLYNNAVLNRTVTYSRVSVSAGTGASQWDTHQYLKLNCSVAGGNVTCSQVYVGAESPVEATADLFGMPVYDTPLNLTFAEFVPACETWNKTGVRTGSTLPIPAGANFLRVACIYTNPCLDADIAPYTLGEDQNWYANCDGVVNLLDLGLVSSNWGESVPPANPFADINHDGVVNLMDLGIVTAHWGQTGSYLPSFGAVAVFSAGGNFSLDSAGCVVIPKQAQGGTGTVGFALKNGPSVGAFVEFFNVTSPSDLNKQSLTDTSGAARFSWTPAQVGDYLVETKLPQHFNATVSQNEPTSVCEPVCTVSYVQVVKRPVTLNLAQINPVDAGQNPYSLDIPACNDTFVWGGMSAGKSYGYLTWGNAPTLVLCSETSEYISQYCNNNGIPTNAEGPSWIFLNFNLYHFFKDASVSRVTLTMYPNFYGDPFGSANRTYGVYAVQHPWSESSLCWNNADTGNSYYNYGTPLAEQTVDLNGPSISNVTWDLTSAFQNLKSYFNGSAAFVYGFMIRDMNPDITDHAQMEFASRDTRPPGNATLHVEFTLPSTVAVEAYDPVLGKPAAGVWVDWWKNGTLQSSVQTDETGYAELNMSYPQPGHSVLGVYNVTAVSEEDDNYSSASGSWVYDYRWCSNITSSQGNAMNATVGRRTTLSFHLYSSELMYYMDLSGMPFDFYVNGVKNASGTTDSSGLVSFGWTPSTNRTYVITARFRGTGIFSPCNFSVCVTAQVVPIAIDFSTSTTQLTLGCSFNLVAKVINLKTNQPLSNYKVDFRRVSSAGGNTSVGQAYTNSNGVATLQNVNYPNDGNAYAYYAKPACKGNQTLASSPLQLTVGCNITLLLSVSRQSSSNTHTFMARLVDNDRNAVPNRVLTLELNDTRHEYNATTNNTGNATWTLQLSPQANDSATVYNVEVSFAGDTPFKSATAYLTSPNGTRCAISTTIQYASYKPSANSTSVLIMPQTTTGETSLKSPDQLQEDAGAYGVSTWSEFSWWYPWYRFHITLVWNGQEQFDIGLTLLPFGDSFYCTDNFMQVVTLLLPKVSLSIVTGLVVAEIAGRIASQSGLGLVIGLLISWGARAYALMTNWNSIAGLASAYIGSLIATAIGIMRTGLWGLFESFLDLLSEVNCLSEIGFGKLYSVISFVSSIAYLGIILQRIHVLGGV
jgi:hypothetical protein